tara:strand:- start:8518 stop:8904 length:387 start_codon:yes stop_codon:yes gene_type:complete
MEVGLGDADIPMSPRAIRANERAKINERRLWLRTEGHTLLWTMLKTHVSINLNVDILNFIIERVRECLTEDVYYNNYLWDDNKKNLINGMFNKAIEVSRLPDIYQQYYDSCSLQQQRNHYAHLEGFYK